MTDLLPISLRPTTRLGSKAMPHARKLGNVLNAAGASVGHRINKGFLLRAVRTPVAYNVFVLDLQALLLMAGSVGYSTVYPYSVVNGCAPVGNRDDFSPPGVANTADSPYPPKTVVGLDWRWVHAPGEPQAKDEAEFTTHLIHGQPVVDGSLLMFSAVRLPMKSTSLYIDDMLAFDSTNTVRVGCAYRLPQVAMTEVAESAPVASYLGCNSFWVNEVDLPSGWKFLPRRQVVATYYANSGAASSERVQYTNTKNWATWTPGANVLRAAGDITVDKFTMAVEGVNQHQGTFYYQDPAATDPQYLLNFYDQYGEHALLILRGELDPTSSSTQQLYAALVDTVLIRASDIPRSDLQPSPLTLEANAYGKPAYPNWCRFMQPSVVRCTDDMMVFVNYRAPYQNDAVSGTPASDALIYAVALVLPDDNVQILRGDSFTSFSSATTYIPAGGNTVWAAIPWIVGSDSVARTQDDGTVRRTAYALVWEDHWSRLDGGGVIRPTRLEDEFTDKGKWFFTSYSTGGNWALYAYESGVPSRVEITNDFAPLFAPQMVAPSYFPSERISLASAATIPGESHLHDTYSSMYYAGDDKMVVALIDASVANDNQIWQAYPNRVLTGPLRVITHDVHCGVLDLKTNTLTKVGTITTRDDLYAYCHITVAQPFVAADEETGSAAIPATLLASMFNISPAAFGLQSSTLDKTAVFVSVDGGGTWVEYVSDQSGPNGAFLIGNSLWANSVTTRYDEDLAG